MSPEEYALTLLWYKKMQFMNTIIDMSFYVVPSILGAGAFGIGGYLIYNTAQGLVNTAKEVFSHVISVGIGGVISGIAGGIATKSIEGAIKGFGKGVIETSIHRMGIPLSVLKHRKPVPKTSSPSSPTAPSSPTSPSSSIVITPSETKEFREGLVMMNTMSPQEIAKMQAPERKFKTIEGRTRSSIIVVKH